MLHKDIVHHFIALELSCDESRSDSVLSVVQLPACRDFSEQQGYHRHTLNVHLRAFASRMLGSAARLVGEVDLS